MQPTKTEEKITVVENIVKGTDKITKIITTTTITTTITEHPLTLDSKYKLTDEQLLEVYKKTQTNNKFGGLKKIREEYKISGPLLYLIKSKKYPRLVKLLETKHNLPL